MAYIDGLPAASAVSPTDLIAIDQGGTPGVAGTATTRRASISQLQTATVAFVVNAAPFLNGGTIENGGTITSATQAAAGLAGWYNNGSSIVASVLGIGAGLSLSVSGNLENNGVLSPPTITIGGAVIGSGTTNIATTLSSVWAGGTFGSASLIPVVTIGTDGLTTGVTTVANPTYVSDVVAGAGLFTNAGTAGGSITSTGTLNMGEFLNTQTGSAYTLAASDQAKLVNLTNGVGATLHVNTSLLTAGFYADLISNSAFISTVIASSGTIFGAATNAATITIPAYSGGRLVFDGVNTEFLAASPFNMFGGGQNVGLFYGLAVGAAGQQGTIGVGTYSMGIGNGNVLNGSWSLAVGQSNTVASGGGTNSLVVGTGHVSKANGSSISGLYGSDSATTSRVMGANGGFSGTPKAQQVQEFVMSGVRSTGTTAVRLLVNGGTTPAATNVGSLASNAFAGFEITVQVHDTTAGGSIAFTYGNTGMNRGQIAQTGTTAATTTLTAGGTWASSVQLGSIQSLGTMSLAADTTNGGLDLEYTPGAGNTSAMSVLAFVRYITA